MRPLMMALPTNEGAGEPTVGIRWQKDLFGVPRTTAIELLVSDAPSTDAAGVMGIACVINIFL